VAFSERGMPVPEDSARWNAHALTEGRGWPWSPNLDELIGRQGAELLAGEVSLVCLDLDVTVADGGVVERDGAEVLAALARARGHELSSAGAIVVRTPGNDGHAPGWHLWFRAPREPVRLGPLTRPAILDRTRPGPLPGMVTHQVVLGRLATGAELKSHATCPGSPGYRVVRAPDEPTQLPAWIARMAGPRPAVLVARPGPALLPGFRPAYATGALVGEIGRLLDAPAGTRNAQLNRSAFALGRLAGAGLLDTGEIERALSHAAGHVGLTAEDGQHAVLATIRSGLQSGMATAGHLETIR
jgi:hypothetical protein